MRLNGIMRLRIVAAAILWAISLALFYNWFQTTRSELARYQAAAAGDESGISESEKTYIANTLKVDACGLTRPWDCDPTIDQIYAVYAEHAKNYSDLLARWPIELLRTLILPGLFWIVGSVLGWIVRGFKKPAVGP